METISAHLVIQIIPYQIIHVIKTAAHQLYQIVQYIVLVTHQYVLYARTIIH